MYLLTLDMQQLNIRIHIDITGEVWVGDETEKQNIPLSYDGGLVE